MNKQAFAEGRDDDHLHQILIETAQLYADDFPEEEHDDIIESYIQGFISCYTPK